MEFSLQAALIRSRLKPELQTSAQKWILTINCMMRGSRAPLTVPKPVDVVDGAVRFEVQVRRRRVRQAGEIERGIDAAELSVVEHVEGVGPQLQATAFPYDETLLQRQVRVVDARGAQVADRTVQPNAAYRRNGEGRRVQAVIRAVAGALQRISDQFDARAFRIRAGPTLTSKPGRGPP